ncbi:helix-turn-helix transcriptional regulator [Shimazuella sp. AN120528]|uniref:winged helix-turn-helix transcriptional regulator n=1 Tax=Shimazuella soli TaxID=1892854 RepID=UPI001F10D517|nr:helix-turn-helix domain-containing protein [Shimazuella soli]MCH5586112.1 helix-turn-helix transcriptional regulator [Shimazuella soli]
MHSNDGIHGCPVENVLGMLSRKRKPAILYELFQRTMSFGQLQRAIPKVYDTIQLRELEEDGLINRTIYPVVPPKIEYRIATIGKELESILDEFSQILQKRD